MKSKKLTTSIEVILVAKENNRISKKQSELLTMVTPEVWLRRVGEGFDYFFIFYYSEAHLILTSMLFWAM